MKNAGIIILLTAIPSVMVGSAFTLAYTFLSARKVVTSRLSPDETTRAVLVEPRFSGAERTLSLRLESLKDGEAETILDAPGVGGPAGTERLVWSKDGTKLVLVGRHFFVRDDAFLDNGDQLYFLHDLKAGRSYRNAPDGDPGSPLTPRLIEGVEFTEPVRLKPG